MKELVKFELSEGGSVLVEVDDTEPGYDRVARRPGELAADAGKQFAAALDVIRPATETIVQKLRYLSSGPEKVEVQFGIRLNAQAGAVIASTQIEGHLQVTLTWTNPNNSASSAS